MSIAVTIVVLEQPYGNPGSLGEPLGIFMGEVNIAGDGSGGFVEVRWVPQNILDTPPLPDKRLEHVYFVDGGAMQTLGAVSSGVFVVSYETHWARANVAIVNRFAHRFAARPQLENAITTPLDPIYADYVSRFPIFWERSELGLGSLTEMSTMRWEANTIAQTFTARIYGRFYDRQVLANRAFGRLISPPAISQF